MTNEKLIRNYEWSFNKETGDIDIKFEFQIPADISEEDEAEFLAFMKQELAKGIIQHFGYSVIGGTS
jgi:hypothetical protein